MVEPLERRWTERESIRVVTITRRSLHMAALRTTDAATTQIKTTAKSDPLTTLEVKNNQDNVDGWKKKKEAAVKAADAAKTKKVETEQQ